MQKQEDYKMLCFLLPVNKTLKEIQHFLDSVYFIHNIELKNNSPEFWQLHFINKKVYVPTIEAVLISRHMLNFLKIKRAF